MQTAEYVCQVQDIPARPTLSVRRVAAVQELPQAMGSAYGAVMAYAGAQGIPVEGPAYVIYYNMDMRALDMEIGFFSMVMVASAVSRAGKTPMLTTICRTVPPITR